MVVLRVHAGLLMVNRLLTARSSKEYEVDVLIVTVMLALLLTV